MDAIDPNRPDGDGVTPLGAAIEEGNLEAAEMILSKTGDEVLNVFI